MDLTVIVLAAGKGTRMKSAKAKVLHELFFAPMIHHVLDAVGKLSAEKTIVVVGHQGNEVVKQLNGYNVKCVTQQEQLGTGHAVLVTEKYVQKGDGIVLVLCGDTPLIKPETLLSMLEFHQNESDNLTVMTTIMDDPTNYGRIISDENDNLIEIVEEKDLAENERCISEINAGIYCVDTSFLFESLKKIGTDNQQGEIYFTDIVKIASDAGCTVKKFICRDSSEIIGVNSRVELEKAAKILQLRRNKELMDAGVSIMDTDTIFIGKTVSIERDSIIYPHVFITGSTAIGKGVKILPFSKIHNMTIDDYVTVQSFSNLTGKNVE
jgi:bifunctional UDP-N-acetylglucosamine pyrophosphorylase/glucosamine-1-phosphate N-acetyltransferase